MFGNNLEEWPWAKSRAIKSFVLLWRYHDSLYHRQSKQLHCYLGKYLWRTKFEWKKTRVVGFYFNNSSSNSSLFTLLEADAVAVDELIFSRRIWIKFGRSTSWVAEAGARWYCSWKVNSATNQHASMFNKNQWSLPRTRLYVVIAERVVACRRLGFHSSVMAFSNVTKWRV